jgi:uncharacterized delta-60 repeat protein
MKSLKKSQSSLPHGLYLLLPAVVSLLLILSVGTGTASVSREKRVLQVGAVPEKAIRYGRSRILVLGTSFDETPVMFRLRADGSLDNSFAGGHLLKRPWVDAAVLPNGKILVLSNRRQPDGTLDPLLTRLLPDGRLDRTLGRNGTVAVDFGRRYNRGDALALAPNGKIVVGGVSTDELERGPRGERGFFTPPAAVARLRPGGAPDRSFSGDGVFHLSSSRLDSISDFGLAADGSIFAFDGSSDILKLRSGGSLVARYGDHGVAAVPTLKPIPGAEFLFLAHQMVVLPGGKVLVAGSSPRTVSHKFRSWVIALRLGKNGRRDRSYGHNRHATVESRRSVFAQALTGFRHGRLIVASITRSPAGDIDAGAVAFTPNGAVDRAFGHGGMLTRSFPGAVQTRAVVPQGNGFGALLGYSLEDGSTGPMRPSLVFARVPLR